MLTTLLITYVLNGTAVNTQLVSSSMESCMQDARIAEVTVRHMGGVSIDTSCVDR